jgi:hypothetical protein
MNGAMRRPGHAQRLEASRLARRGVHRTYVAFRSRADVRVVGYGRCVPRAAVNSGVSPGRPTSLRRCGLRRRSSSMANCGLRLALSAFSYRILDCVSGTNFKGRTSDECGRVTVVSCTSTNYQHAKVPVTERIAQYDALGRARPIATCRLHSHCRAT